MSLQIDIRLQRGDFELVVDQQLDTVTTGVFGPSGCGKSTLLAALAGLLPASGKIVLGGRVLLDSAAGICLPPERRRVGLVFQELRLFPHLTVAQNLRYGRGDHARWDELISLLEIAPLLQRTPQALSGGERQRVALGRALLAGPDLLLLDEPLSALDARLAMQILPYLRRVTAAVGVPLLAVSHSWTTLAQLSEEVMVMRAGRIVGAGPPSALLRDPTVLDATRGQGVQNVIEVTQIRDNPDAGWVEGQSQGTSLRLPPDPPASARASGRGYVALRPTDIVLAVGPLGRTSARNTLRGTVIERVAVANRWWIRVDTGVPLWAEVTQSAVEELGLNPGVSVTLLVKTTSFCWVG